MKFNFYKITLVTFFLLLFTSCKIIKILKKGTVVQKNYREEISFESRAGLIVVKVNIGGKDYNFIYDSGATNCVTKELAEVLHLKPVVNQVASDSEGKTDLFSRFFICVSDYSAKPGAAEIFI